MSPAMPASWCCATPPTAACSTWAAGPARFRPRCAVPSRAGIATSASSPAAAPVTATPITWCIGPMAGRRSSPTWFHCAGSTTARCTKKAFKWSPTSQGGSSSCARMAHRCRRLPPAPQWQGAGAPLAPTVARLAAAGITIGPHTATPEWYGESPEPGGGARRAVATAGSGTSGCRGARPRSLRDPRRGGAAHRAMSSAPAMETASRTSSPHQHGITLPAPPRYCRRRSPRGARRCGPPRW